MRRCKESVKQLEKEIEKEDAAKLDELLAATVNSYIDGTYYDVEKVHEGMCYFNEKYGKEFVDRFAGSQEVNELLDDLYAVAAAMNPDVINSGY